ncbi:MAG: divalent-cation tolerance protein CutA [Kordiimonas sp.]|nr:divalent-cation tolerance protein CutA [Kordiimonas sp.]|tara:strand:+ start:695 stop:1009 length:315 start_codon:yes stop_codon:yes gene_type:complete
MDGCIVYMTCGSVEEAKDITKKVVEERLAACGNIMAPITSIYEWDGKLAEEAEIGVMLKTREVKATDLMARLKELHSYDVPCIIRWSMSGGDPDYLHWLYEKTA